ncbi:MAG: PAS domain-containing protein [Rhizobiales bacterium]|nr:PAS domain-containing protein [Hyphomicrobiales bacterium]
MSDTATDNLDSNGADVGDAEAVLRSLWQPIIMVGGDDRIILANEAAQQFFQASITHLQRHSVAELVPFSSPLPNLIEQVRRRGGTVNEYAVDLSLPEDTAPRLVDIQVAPVAERPDAVMIVLLERSMAMKIDRQLSHRGAARSVNGLTALLAHEVKNPLFGIRGAAQLLSTTVGSDDLALTQLICDETDRICTLVDRMEVFSHDRPMERRPVNIHTVLDRVRDSAAAGVARGIRFIEDYDPSLPPVLGDRDQLIQVFLNLVKNAAEALNNKRGEAEITLKTAYLPGMRLSVPGLRDNTNLPLEFTVADNGPGISDELIPHMFDPFVSGRESGSGLGLALVAKIIGEHGGVIECESSPRGTKFRILMPMHQGPAPEE